MTKPDISMAVPVLKKVLSYKLYLISALIIVIFMFTILEVQQVGSNLTSQTLIQEKRQEVLSGKIIYDEAAIAEIIERTSPGANAPVQPAPVSNNPFRYGN